MNLPHHVEVIVKALADLNAIREPEIALLASGDVDLAALGLDSISIVDFCLLLEKALGREVSVDELIANPTVKRLAAHLAGPEMEA